MNRTAAFKKAVLDADLDAVRCWLDEGVDPDTPIDAKRSSRERHRDTSAEGFRALHVAAYEDDAALGELLLRRGADPWATTRFGLAPLELAADWSSPAFVRAFLAAGIDPDATRARPLVVAAGRGHAAIVDLLLAAGARNGLGVAVTSACSYNARPAILTALLDAGADPERPADPEEWTPRIAALYSRNAECLRILRARTRPLTLIDAAIDGDVGAVASFLASGDDPNVTARHGVSALLGAASQGHGDVVTRLLDAGAHVNHCGAVGSAIERALLGNHLHVADILYERGARLHNTRHGSVFGALIHSGVDAATFEWVRERHRPERIHALLGRAAAAGDRTAVRVLLAMGASIDGRDGWGRPPLALAAYANRVEMVAFLLERGADPAIRDENGRPILHYLLVYDDYTDDWLAADFDESRYDRSHPILRSEAVRLLLEAGTPLPWSHHERPVGLVIAVDDPHAGDVRVVIARHLAFAREVTPPGGVHALGIEALRDPRVTFVSARIDGQVVGIAALKELDEAHGELKSMHTIESARGRGIGRALVEHLLALAAARKYRRVSLETGVGDAFAPARSLYETLGFRPTAAFGDYVSSPTSAYMTIELGPRR